MALTDTAVRLAKAGDIDRKLSDEKGLYLLVTATGSKLWRVKYRIAGKEKKLALGSYPAVSLKDARAKRDEARRTTEAGNDPAAVKREARPTAIAGAAWSPPKIASDRNAAAAPMAWPTKVFHGRAASLFGVTVWM